MSKISRVMKDNAEAFIIRWRGTTSEHAEAQTFCNEFFQIFGLYRKDYATFEKPIRKKNEKGTGFADLFWSGKLIIESKSAHLDSPKHWEKTLAQAVEYIDGLKLYQKPKYILLMNFKRIQKHSVEIIKNKTVIKLIKEIPIEELDFYIDEFQFFIDFTKRLEEDEEKVNQDAAKLIANVYDALAKKGYNANEDAILLSRLLFCLFAEDTGIFENNQFGNYIRENTAAKTLGDHIVAIFETLNTPVKKRKHLNKELSAFPYVNGNLFSDDIKVPPISGSVRDALIKCCEYDWSDVSPVIFGALFQAILKEKDRRSLGAHFTSEKNILRVINPLFLDKLKDELFAIKKNNKIKLNNFRKKIANLYFLDPACGCGNFLVVIYKELRLLDIEIVKRQYGGKYVTDASLLKNISLENFYGYEIDPTSSMIAEISMWLAEHQMNMRLESEFGTLVPTIPLDEAAVINSVNSLLIEWNVKLKNIKGVDVQPSFDYIIGNPPFIGKQERSPEQKEDMKIVFSGVSGAGVLDYVSAWYIKTGEYIKRNNKTKSGLVSTNSITQGEQPGILWNELFTKYNLKIIYAHRTFKWHNEAKGVAAVHCVIIGFANNNQDIPKTKKLFDYKNIDSEPHILKAKNINPYLVNATDLVILKRKKPICNVSEISFGSMPNDGGEFLFSEEEKEVFLKSEPKAKSYIKPLLSAHEFLNRKKRWCLWLKNISQEDLKNLKEVNKRVQNVKKIRSSSPRAATKALAKVPHLFGEIRQPDSNFILIPLHSSENRSYIPMGFFTKSSIANNSTSVIPNATLFEFGILNSKMHMTWVVYTCGRIKSDYRYSNEMVYNNYPWPKTIDTKNKKLIEEKAQKILDERSKCKDLSLAKLYDPSKMPAELLKAHKSLDKAVDTCYSNAIFKTDKKRIEFLFEEYNKLINNLKTKKSG